MSLKAVTQRWQSYAPQTLALLRLVTAWIFIISGTTKLFGWPMHMPEGVPPIAAFSEVWFAGVLETFGGALLFLGLLTGPVAFILSGEMAVAYWQFHAGATPLYPIMNNGVAAVTCCFIWLHISAAGPGAWSVDALIAKRTG